MTTIAILNPNNLLGRELREGLGQHRELWDECLLLSARDEDVGTLTEIGSSAAMVEAFDPEALDKVDIFFLGGSWEECQGLLPALPQASTRLLVAPDAEAEEAQPLVAGVNLEQAERGTLLSSPHPAAVALAHLLHPLATFQPRRAVATILLPASLYGEPAMDEIFSQTRNIVAFTGQDDPSHFPAQMAFNLLPAAQPSGPVVRQLGQVLASDYPLSLQLVQAGVFHGVGVSLQVELGAGEDAREITQALGDHPMNVLVDEPESLGPVATANQQDVLVGAVEEDAQPGSFRIWAVMDNLTRGGATNALQILEALVHRVTH